jgi:gluconate 2-dehydrogenase gamma chain
MTRHSDPKGISRRTLFARVAVLGAGAAVVRGDTPAAAPARGTHDAEQAPAAARPPLENLTAAEMATLEAIAAQLIPSDGNGPGATEAGAAHYIDRALGGALALTREAYRTGLAAVDAHARSSMGAAFDRLAATERDAVLRDVETGNVPGFGDAPGFFNLVRTHTIQGMFGDPYYGGNMNFAGWELIGYPGLRLSASADDQRMDRKPVPIRRSAYEHAMFAKKRPARASSERE